MSYAGLLAIVQAMAMGAFQAPSDAEELVVYACVSIPGGAFSTPERYRELAEAGFNASLTGFANLDEAIHALDAARGSGVRVFVACPELASDTKTAVARLRTHPALAGYHLKDEPSASAFDELGAWVRRIQALDAEHPCYINLLPTYAGKERLGTRTYVEYVDQFVKKVPVPLISFDHYPTMKGRVEPGVFRNLEIIAGAARRARKPFWGFYLANVLAPDHPARTLEALRFESFINLAYGAQGIQAFTYWETFPGERDSPIDKEGNRTATYALVKQVNVEVRAWSHVFLRAEVLSVSHAGKRVPAGTRAFAPSHGLSRLEVGAGGAVVSCLKKGKHQFIVIVNKDIHRALELTVEFKADRRVSEARKGGGNLPVTGNQYRVAAGDVLVFRVD